MIELLSYPFMQRALLAALLTGLIAPAIGTYIVQRRLSLLGDGLGHVAIAGVGLALLTGQAPIPIAVVVCVAGAVAVEVLRQRGKATGDVGLAILFYGGLAAGVLMSGIAGQGAGALSPVPVRLADHGQRRTTWCWSPRSPSWCWCRPSAWRPQLFAVSADEEFARTQGLPDAALQPADRGAGRRHRDPGHAHGRPAAGQRADGGAGGGRAEPGPRLLRRAGRGHGDRVAVSVGGAVGVVLRRHRARRADRGAGHRRLRAQLADLAADRPPT